MTLTPDGILTVANDGPVVPPERLAHLTTRFERAGSRAPGSGLGLTIAAGIASAMGQELRLMSPRPGAETGFAARVSVIATGLEGTAEGAAGHGAGGRARPI